MHITWHRSPSSHPTARCGTPLSPSQVSRWSTCWHASSWSERFRRSSAQVQTTWAKERGLTGPMGTCSVDYAVSIRTLKTSMTISNQMKQLLKQSSSHSEECIITAKIFFPLLTYSVFIWCGGLFFLLTTFCKPLPLWPELDCRGGLSLTTAGLWLTSWTAAHHRW